MIIMEGTLIALVFLALVGFWPPLRRLTMALCVIMFLGMLAIGHELDPDPENSIRDFAVISFGGIWVLLLLCGMAQAAFLRRRSTAVRTRSST